MSVQKFHSVEEMDVVSAPNSAGDGFSRFLRHCARYWSISPRHYPRGVFKYRSIEDAQRARERISDPIQAPRTTD